METVERMWARLRRRSNVKIQDTGPAVQSGGGRAVSGYSGPAPRPGTRITVRNTGPAVAEGPGGSAVSGIDHS